MPVSQQVLNNPIDWHDTSLWPLLDELQGNILKGHGRDHSINLFLKFDEAHIEAVRGQIRAIGTQTTSALRQLNEVEAFKIYHRPGGTSIFFYLSASGYRKLSLALPDGEAFAQGMAQRSLGDPDVGAWEPHLKPGIDALLLIADDTDAKVANVATALSKSFVDNGISIIGRDAGHALRSEPSTNEPKGRGIEHFGYVDGRSQPLLLLEDVQVEEHQNGGIGEWDPSFGPLQAALVRDPNGATADSYGSFLVYRKLEQNVKGFKQAEKDLAKMLQLTGDDDERAGAMVVGRFEDGSPLVLHKSASDPNPVPNNFNYGADPDGLKCPIHAHIRKVNPRTLGEEAQERRSHLMPRRGIPFGDPNRDFENAESFPEGGVGLLFMAYNQNLENQFEVSQRFWANDPGFPDDTGTGQDPIIGQAPPQDQTWHADYGVQGPTTKSAFDGFVTMKGGEYFFAPSRAFLKTI